MYHKYFKRIIDIVGSIIGLIITSPVLLLAGISLAIVNQGSPFFVQPRPGKNRKIFNIIKFKTMYDKRDEDGELLSNFERIHPPRSENYVDDCIKNFAS